jgi:hypothetical protein
VFCAVRDVPDAFCVVAYFVRAWIYDRNGLGIPADFISFWAAGRLPLDGFPT